MNNPSPTTMKECDCSCHQGPFEPQFTVEACRFCNCELSEEKECIHEWKYFDEKREDFEMKYWMCLKCKSVNKEKPTEKGVEGWEFSDIVKEMYEDMEGDPTLRMRIHETILTSLRENGVDLSTVNHNDIRRNTYPYHDLIHKERQEARREGYEQGRIDKQVEIFEKEEKLK